MTRPRIIWTAALAALVIALAVIVLGSSHAHTLRATFSSAVNVVPGAEVRAGGVRIGSVRSITVHGKAAQVELGIDDDHVWPLRAGTRASIRLGGNVSYANRYVELLPGAGTGGPLPDGFEIPVEDTSSPLEFDQLFDTFDTRTRAGMGTLIDRGATTLGPRGRVLRRGLAQAGRGLGEGGKTLTALAGDPSALSVLVRASATTAGELARRDAQLRDLVDGAARTLTTVASNGPDVQRTIARLPVAARSLRGTLARVDHSLTGVDQLVGDIAPGARQLRRFAPPLGEAVATLREVAPGLQATLARVQRSGATIAGFLDEAIPQVKRLRPTLAHLAPMMACVRAYSPEIASFFSTWAALGTSYDRGGRYALLNGQAMPFPDASTSSSATVARTFPQLRYSLLRPPGYGAGESLFSPKCGATEQMLDPTHDPEGRR